MATRGGRNSLAPSSRNFYQQPKRRRKDLRAASVHVSFQWGTSKAEGKGEQTLPAPCCRNGLHERNPLDTFPKHQLPTHSSAHILGPARKASGLKSTSKINIYHCKRQYGAKPCPCQEPPVPSLARHRVHEQGATGLLHRQKEPARSHLRGCLTYTHSLWTAVLGAGMTTCVFGFILPWK